MILYDRSLLLTLVSFACDSKAFCRTYHMGENTDLAARSAVELGVPRGSTYVSDVIRLLLEADEVLDVDDRHFRTLSARRGTIRSQSKNFRFGWNSVLYFLRRNFHPPISRLYRVPQ